MLAHGFRDGAENDAGLGEFGLEGGDNRNTVEYRINGDTSRHYFVAVFIKGAFLALLAHAGQNFLLFQRNAKLGIGFQKLGVNFIKAFRPGHALWRGVIVEVLEINFGK